MPQKNGGGASMRQRDPCGFFLETPPPENDRYTSSPYGRGHGFKPCEPANHGAKRRRGSLTDSPRLPLLKEKALKFNKRKSC